MSNIKYSRMDPAEVNQRVEYGRKHLCFCAQLYKIQPVNGRHFLHEHPETAASWQEGCIKRLMAEQGVTRVVGDQCMYGLKSNDGLREGPARKSTAFLTNSPCVAKHLSRRCLDRRGQEIHGHVRLENGRARKAQEYLDNLCRAICRGLQEQLKVDASGQFLLSTVDLGGRDDSSSVRNEMNRLKQQYKIVEEEEDNENLEIAWDDVSGVALDPQRC